MTSDTPSRPGTPWLLLVIAYLGFISLGLPDTLIGVAWPSVRDAFGRQQSEVAWVFFAAGGSYFLSSLFAGRLMKWLGIGMLLAVSSLLVAGSGFGYASSPVWPLFASCALLHGAGSGAIDAGLNHYVAHHFSARHMTWLHACYGVGATLGPLIMTSVLVASGSWRAGYATVACILLSLALLFALTRKRWEEKQGGSADASAEAPAPAIQVGMMKALKHPMVGLQIVLFFIYTGLEVTLGQWSFTILTEARGFTKEAAGTWVTAYWASLTMGRVLFGFIVDRFGIDRLLRMSMLAVMVGTGIFAANLPHDVSAAGLALVGLGLAAIYPCLMTRTPQRLGAGLSAHAIGFQVSAAMIGAAAFPSVAGMLAQQTDLNATALLALGMAVAIFAVHEMLLRMDQRRESAAA